MNWSGVGCEQYKRIVDTVEFFTARGYKEVLSDWAVTSKAMELTRPKSGVAGAAYLGRELVASAEQSLLQRYYLEQKMPPSEYLITVSPCFRTEEIYDDLSRPYFLKAELMCLNFKPGSSLMSMIDRAEENFKNYIKCDVVETPEGYDIVSRRCRIELGSYGIRQLDGLQRWMYGTALAEPRLTEAIRLENRAQH